MSIGLTKVSHPTLGEVVFHRISDFVPKQNQDILESELSKEEFSWNFVPPDSNKRLDQFQKIGDISIFGHKLVSDGKVESNYFAPIIDTVKLESLISKYELTGDVLRSQVNLLVKRDVESISCPHVDINRTPHFGILYYVNDSDGDTIFYNRSEYDHHRLEGFDVWKKETPKKR